MKYLKLLGSVALASALALEFTGCGSSDSTVGGAAVTGNVATINGVIVSTSAVIDGTTLTSIVGNTFTVNSNGGITSTGGFIDLNGNSTQDVNEPDASTVVGTSTDTTLVVQAVGISPYQRIAVLDGTWDDVPALAEKIARYVVDTDEAAVLGYPTNWVVAGANPASNETFETSDLLPIPAAGVKDNTGKSRVIELCNGAYAKQATNTGRFHGSALPCEVSVHSDGTKIYVDMLDADAIFSVFFSDIPAEQKPGLGTVASAVKGEIRGMVLASLASDTHTVSTKAMGPSWNAAEIEAHAAGISPYKVYSYKRTDGGTFVTGTDDKAIAAEIITALGTDTATADTIVTGLSTGSAWRSARPEPLAIPGVQVVEACSPKYATMATKLGNQYITALPCEITVLVDENDATGKTLTISVLDPSFMFGVMFEGAVSNATASGAITADEATAYNTLASTVFTDLKTIVDHVITTSPSGLVLSTASSSSSSSAQSIPNPFDTTTSSSSAAATSSSSSLQAIPNPFG